MAKILAKNLFDYLDGLGDLPQNSVFRVVLEGEFLSNTTRKTEFSGSCWKENFFPCIALS